MKKIISFVIIILFIFSGISASEITINSKNGSNNTISYLKTENIVINFPDINDVQIINENKYDLVKIDGFYCLNSPGEPMLPSKNYNFILPPGANVVSVDVKGFNAQKLSGLFEIKSTPYQMPIGDKELLKNHIENSYNLWMKNYKSTFGSEENYPTQPGRLNSQGNLGKYSYVSISICPFEYNVISKELYYYQSVDISINYSISKTNIQYLDVKNFNDVAFSDKIASELFENFDELKDSYENHISNPLQKDNFDYVIITTTDLSDAITNSNFVNWKTILGYNIKIVYVTDSDITSQPGIDLAEQIRNFLREKYIEWGINYVLFVGDYETVPMRYCYPDPSNHQNTAGTPGGTGGEVPTDYYFADLSSSDADSWDYDGDGYYGEYGQDNPDFAPEVYVGRIPVNDPSKITYALDKIVTFEQDKGSWKNNALNAGAFFYFTEELGSGVPAMDGAVCCAYIENDIMTDWTVSHYSEQAGLEASVYNWDPLSEAAVSSDWRDGQYSIVNWGAHGWTNLVARKVWEIDDGDEIPEANEISWPTLLSTNSNLDDDYPSIVTAISCYVGYPEANSWGNMGIDLLTRQFYGASVGVISSARSPYGSIDWPNNPGGSDHIIYEFNRNLINNSEKVGEAFYNSKYYCNLEYGWDSYIEYIDMYTFNLFGDPSLDLKGFEGSIPSVDITKPIEALYLANIKILSLKSSIIIGKIDIEVDVSDDSYEIDSVEILINDELLTTLYEELFIFRWDDRVFGKNKITVKAKNLDGFYGRDDIEVWKFF